MGLQVSSDDYERLSKFRLSLRWIDFMPQDDYFRIHPVNPLKAKVFWEHVTGFLEKGQLNPALFQVEPQFDASGEPGPVSDWLLQRDSSVSQFVLLFWDESTAVLTEWEIFIQYWDDFCYPSSDDVIIYPLSGKWLLLYDHEEILQFGRLKT